MFFRKTLKNAFMKTAYSPALSWVPVRRDSSTVVFRIQKDERPPYRVFKLRLESCW